MKQFIICLMVHAFLSVISLRSQSMPVNTTERIDYPGLNHDLPGTRQIDYTNSINHDYFITRDSGIWPNHLQDGPFGNRFITDAEFPDEFHPDRLNDRYHRNCFLPKIGNAKINTTSDKVREAWVRHYASGLAPGYDVAVDIVADAVGNVYVTGYSTGAPFGMDYLTIKYDPSGNQVWTARYDGEYNDDDRPDALDIDAAGNVYVTGRSWSEATYYDYVTIKYNALGEQQWVARYDELRYDYPHDLAVDVSGNVYVTGSSGTIKYSPDGKVEWIAIYTDSTGYITGGTALVLDNAGSIYIAGTIYNHISSHNFVTLKYDQTGRQKWAAVYNGPGNGSDFAMDIAVDKSGNIYVTGDSKGVDGNIDYATIKYGPDGIQRWIRRYDGSGNGGDYPSALALDDSGNVYITGTSYNKATGNDFATIKYNPLGDQKWIALHNSGKNYPDYAQDIAVDHNGNIYVAGQCFLNDYNYATIKYNPNGEKIWIAYYDGPERDDQDQALGIALDDQGNIYVTGSSYIYLQEYNYYSKYLTIKYDANGVQQWTANYNSNTNSIDYSTDLGIDTEGNIYVTGKSMSQDKVMECATIKYNDKGVMQWLNRYHGPKNSASLPVALRVHHGSDGSKIYLTGYDRLDNSRSYRTLNYGSDGALLWSRSYYNLGKKIDDYAIDMAVDKPGNIYVTGNSRDVTTLFDYLTIKYNPEGTEQWLARYNSPQNGDDIATAMTVDAEGNVYVTGSSPGSDYFYGYLTIKYDTDGNRLWTAFYPGPNNYEDRPSAIAVDRLGNVYVTGKSGISYDSMDFLTVKYNSNGDQLWIARYNGTGNGIDEAIGIAVDCSANVYITGASMGMDKISDIVTIKYDSTGNEEWIERYGYRNRIDSPSAMALDNFNNIYVTGTSDYDFLTIKYDPFGQEQWNIRYAGYENSTEYARALAIDAFNNVYVTGNSYDYGWSIFTTIKYEQIQESKTPDAYFLCQNYPNPFNHSTTIRYTLPQPTFVKLEIFNTLGQKVVTLVDTPQNAGDYGIAWQPTNLASGVYVYRLQADRLSETRKLLFLR